jgi:5-methyltetrahydrofolate--homocysteine methyltransferase
METKISSVEREVIISDTVPTRLIGERINPTGKKGLQEALKSRDDDYIKKLATSQVEAGADILDVNVVTPGVDEISVLPRVLELVMNTVEAPLCIDINNTASLKGALEVYEGKALVNSVSMEEASFNEVLPLVSEYGAAVIGLTIDDEGIPKEAGKRVEIAHRLVEKAAEYGILKEDIIMDCLCLTVGSDSNAGVETLEAIRRVREELGVNQTLGASNISFGLPNRLLLNQIFLAIAIAAGLTCPTVNIAHVCSTVRAVDLMLGRDRFATRYIQEYRKQTGGANETF